MDTTSESFINHFNNLEAGYGFHSQLAEYIKKAVTNVNDYLMSRSLEKDELLSQLNNQPQPNIPRPALPRSNIPHYHNPAVPTYPPANYQPPYQPYQGYPNYRPGHPQ